MSKRRAEEVERPPKRVIVDFEEMLRTARQALFARLVEGVAWARQMRSDRVEVAMPDVLMVHPENTACLLCRTFPQYEVRIRNNMVQLYLGRH